jgi:hypothetical protein
VAYVAFCVTSLIVNKWRHCSILIVNIAYVACVAYVVLCQENTWYLLYFRRIVLLCVYGHEYRQVNLELSTAYTHHSEPQLITALSPISTLHKPQQHPLSPFQPAVFTSCFLSTASSSADSSACRPRVLLPQQSPCRSQLNCQHSTNCVPVWMPFHINLLVFLSQADFQLTTDN